MKNWSIWEKGKGYQKKVFWAVLGGTAAILLYYYAAIPFWEAKGKAEEEIALKQRILAKYAEVLANRKSAEEVLEKTRQQVEEVQKRLLPGETPQLGAANLQDIVKRAAEKNFISLRSFRILEPKEMGSYRKVALQIDFHPISSMVNLSQFMYDLEHQEKEIMIADLDLLIFNPRMPNAIQGHMVISGLMKGSKAKEKGKQK